MNDSVISQMTITQFHERLNTLRSEKMRASGGRKFSLMATDGKRHESSMRRLLILCTKLAKEELNADQKKMLGEIVTKLEKLNSKYKVTLKDHGLCCYLLTKIRQLSNLGFNRTQIFKDLKGRAFVEEEDAASVGQGKHEEEAPVDQRKKQEEPIQDEEKKIKENDLKKSGPVTREVPVAVDAVLSSGQEDYIDELLKDLDKIDIASPNGKKAFENIFYQIINRQCEMPLSKKIGQALAVRALSVKGLNIGFGELVFNIFFKLMCSFTISVVAWGPKHWHFVEELCQGDIPPSLRSQALELFQQISYPADMSSATRAKPLIAIIKDCKDREILQEIRNFSEFLGVGDKVISHYTEEQLKLIGLEKPKEFAR
jgi:hypothetical protein